MKKSIFTLTLLACAALPISYSYGQEPDKKTEKAKENLQEERLDVVEAKVDLKDAQNVDYLAFKEESEMKFKKNEESINDLKIKILKNDEKFRTQDQMRVGVLEQKNISLQKEMNDYKDEGLEKWTAFKNKFNYDLDELTKAIKDFSLLS
jgi:uncharacterized protein YpmB